MKTRIYHIHTISRQAYQAWTFTRPTRHPTTWMTCFLFFPPWRHPTPHTPPTQPLMNYSGIVIMRRFINCCQFSIQTPFIRWLQTTPLSLSQQNHPWTTFIRKPTPWTHLNPPPRHPQTQHRMNCLQSPHPRHIHPHPNTHHPSTIPPNTEPPSTRSTKSISIFLPQIHATRMNTQSTWPTFSSWNRTFTRRFTSSSATNHPHMSGLTFITFVKQTRTRRPLVFTNSHLLLRVICLKCITVMPWRNSLIVMATRRFGFVFPWKSTAWCSPSWNTLARTITRLYW